MAESNKIRSLMGKSQGEEIFEKYWEDFRKGAESNGVSENDASLFGMVSKLWVNMLIINPMLFLIPCFRFGVCI